jgi:outer membrane protein
MRGLIMPVVAAGLLGLIAMGPAVAAPSPPRRISLSEAIGLAMRNNRALQAARLSDSAAQDRVGISRGAMLPRLDALENYSATDNPVLAFSDLLLQQDFSQSDFALSSLNHPGVLSNFQSQIQLSFPVYAGGRLLAGFRAAKFGAQAEDWRAARAREEIVFAVIRAYYGALIAQERVAVVDRALDAARSHLRQAQNLYGNGMAVAADVLRTNVMTGSLEEERVQSASEVAISRATLAHVLGDEDEKLAPMPLAGAAGLSSSPGSEHLENLVQEATAGRPEIKIAAAQVGAAEQAVKIAQADYLPSISVATTYENDSEKLVRAGNNFAVFAYARMNLFDGLATKSKVDAAQAELRRAQVLAQDLTHAIALEVESAYRSLNAAQQKLEVAGRNRRYADAALRILDDRYGAGLATNVTVLDAQTARRQADMDLVQARVGVLLDRAALALALGRPVTAAAR